MADPFTTSFYISTFPPTCLDATPNTAPPFFGGRRARTPTTCTTYPSIFRPTSPKSCSTPPPQSPRPSTSHHHRNASGLTSSRTTNLFVTGRVPSPPCTKGIGADSSAFLGNTNGTCSITGSISFAIGRELLRSTTTPTDYTARYASGCHTANYRGPGAKPSLRSGTASS